MTLPKNLLEKRDELISEKKEPYNDTYKPLVGAMIELGFDSACALLIPEIEKLREALSESLEHAQEYSEGCLFCDDDQEYVAEHGEVSEDHKKICWYYTARQILASIEEFLGEKSEGGDEMGDPSPIKVMASAAEIDAMLGINTENA